MLFFFQAEDGIRDLTVTGVQVCSSDLGHITPEWHALTRPSWGAVESTLRVAGMASDAGASAYIVHMNVAGEVDMLKYARSEERRVGKEWIYRWSRYHEREMDRSCRYVS